MISRTTDQLAIVERDPCQRTYPTSGLRGKTKLLERAATKTITKLSNTTGFVLVEGNFLAADRDKDYSLTFSHPINETLPGKKYSITFKLSKEGIEKEYQPLYKDSIGRSVSLIVLGNVFRPADQTVTEVTLVPFAVYR